MRQEYLFDAPAVDMRQPVIAVNRSVDPREVIRLSEQCQRILDRLRQGPATNRELAAIALKYTSRISDLREAGYRVDWTDRNYQTGEVVYQLVEGPR